MSKDSLDNQIDKLLSLKTPTMKKTNKVSCCPHLAPLLKNIVLWEPSAKLRLPPVPDGDFIVRCYACNEKLLVAAGVKMPGQTPPPSVSDTDDTNLV